MDIMNCMHIKFGKYLTIILKRLSFFFASEFVGEYLIFESLPINKTNNLNQISNHQLNKLTLCFFLIFFYSLGEFSLFMIQRETVYISVTHACLYHVNSPPFITRHWVLIRHCDQWHQFSEEVPKFRRLQY
jgi:hypothetical protein